MSSDEPKPEQPAAKGDGGSPKPAAVLDPTKVRCFYFYFAIIHYRRIALNRAFRIGIQRHSLASYDACILQYMYVYCVGMYTI